MNENEIKTTEIPVVNNENIQTTPVPMATDQSQDEIKTNPNSPTNIENIDIKTVNIDASSQINAKVYVEEEKYKVSGTASEEDLKLEDKPVEEEVIDEHAIKRDVQISDAKFKHNMIYMIVFTLVIFLFIFLMPIIIRIFGM